MVADNRSMSIFTSSTPMRTVLFATAIFQGHSNRLSWNINEMHVTRLLRHDHSGLESLMEAESRWHAADFGGLPLQTSEFLQVSEKQWRQLRDHHHAMSQVQSDIDSVVADATDGTKGASEQKKDNNTGTESKASADILPTGLTEVAHSQYIGPIGVGSLPLPIGCNGLSSFIQPGGTVAKIKPHDKRASLLQNKGKDACGGQDQSQVWVVFDTGSTNLWIASDLCQHGACMKEGRSRYNHTASSSFRHPSVDVQLSVKFGTGKLEGPMAIDDFHIGPFRVKGQSFAMIQKQTGSIFDVVPFEGILGLAWPSMSANHVRPFFDTVIQEKVLPKNQFAFYFSTHSLTANALFWGGVDPAFHEGQIEYFPVVDPHYWAVQLVSFKIGDEVLLKCEAEDCSKVPFPTEGNEEHRKFPKAIVDTGTTFFTFESDLAGKVMKKLPGGKCAKMTVESHPDITFTLRNEKGEDRDFVLSSNQYMTVNGQGEDAVCLPAFMKIDVPKAHGPAMLLGECFLRYYFSVYDRQDGDPMKGRIGLAKSAHSEATLKRLKALTATQPTFAG